MKEARSPRICKFCFCGLASLLTKSPTLRARKQTRRTSKLCLGCPLRPAEDDVRRYIHLVLYVSEERICGAFYCSPQLRALKV